MAVWNSQYLEDLWNEVEPHLTDDEVPWVSTLLRALSNDHDEDKIISVDFCSMESMAGHMFLMNALLHVYNEMKTPLPKGPFVLHVRIPNHGNAIPPSLFEAFLSILPGLKVFNGSFVLQVENNNDDDDFTEEVDDDCRQKLQMLAAAVASNAGFITLYCCGRPRLFTAKELSEASYYPETYGITSICSKHDSKAVCDIMNLLQDTLDTLSLRFTFSTAPTHSTPTTTATKKIANDILLPIFDQLKKQKNIFTLELIMPEQPTASSEAINILAARISSFPHRLTSLHIRFFSQVSTRDEEKLTISLRDNTALCEIKVFLDYFGGDEDYRYVSGDFPNFLKFITNRNKLFGFFLTIEKRPGFIGVPRAVVKLLHDQYAVSYTTKTLDLHPLFPSNSTSMVFEILRLKAGDMFRHALPILYSDTSRGIPTSKTAITAANGSDCRELVPATGSVATASPSSISSHSVQLGVNGHTKEP